MGQTFQVGQVIEFSDAGQHHLGLIRQVAKALTVQTESGERKVGKKSVTFACDHVEPDASSDRLNKWQSQLAGWTDEADLRGIWELAEADGDSLALDDVAELLFDDGGWIAQLAAHRLLRDDRVFFKQKQDLWEPRTASHVEQLEEQQRAEEAARAARNNALETIASLWQQAKKSPQQAGEALHEAAGQDDLLRDMLGILIEYAAQREDAPRRAKATELLTELTQRGIKLSASGWRSAFDILVGLGQMARHENLAITARRLPTDHTDELIAEAVSASKEACGRFDARESIAPNRRDLTELLLCTVDSASTRDIDDGVSAELLDDGTVVVGVHIADPAECVPMDSPLDLEARRRGTSVYLPSGVLPMFPRAMSEGAMSLLPGEVRPALSFFTHFRPDKTVGERHVELTWIRSNTRLTFEEATALIESGEGELGRMLQHLWSVAQAHKQSRLDNGAVVLAFPEVKPRVKGTTVAGHVVELESVEMVETGRNVARDLIQEMMILTGHNAGLHCVSAQVPAVFRCQDPPPTAEQAAELAGKVHELVDAWRLRRFMPRSEFRPIPGRHFGLGLDVYVQASSPIRRYGDLIAHRQIRAHLAGEPTRYEGQELLDLVASVDRTASAGSAVERESKRYWTLHWMAERKGQLLDATVIGFVGDKRDRAQVWIHEAGLPQTLSASRTVALGDAVKVKIEAAKARSDRLTLRMVN